MPEAQELIVVRQLPIIEEQLQQAKNAIQSEVQEVLRMECTVESLKKVRAKRSELNKQFKQFETRRKQVKHAVLEPYNRFERTYKDCVTNLYDNADIQLKGKITAVETTMKKEKQQEVETYFDEYVNSIGISWLTFSMAEIAVGLSDSITKLKKQSKNFVDKVHDDLVAISTQEHNSEILMEYKKSFDLSKAIAIVTERHKQIEDEKARRAVEEQKSVERQQAAQKVDDVLNNSASAPESLQPPVAEHENTPTPENKDSDNKIYQLTFKIRATKERLIALKKFLNDGGYDYE